MGILSTARRCVPLRVAPSGPVNLRFSRFALAHVFHTSASVGARLTHSPFHSLPQPVDVVKTRMQLDPVKYNKGMVGGFRQVIAAEGAGALLTGLGATAAGYFVQGWFKFGGVEFFKINIAAAMGEQAAWDNRTAIYLAAAGGAEFIADLFLCPLEAVRIRSVADPAFPQSLPAGAARIMSTEGVGGFYAGLGPILFKQIPYTMAKFAVQGLAADAIYTSMNSSPSKQSGATNMSISLSTGVLAGVTAAIISHPADTLLSKINKAGAGGTGSTSTRLVNIAREMGFAKLCTTGLGPRCVMIGTLTAGQFGIFDIVMGAVGAKKFHFHGACAVVLLPPLPVGPLSHPPLSDADPNSKEAH
jgi:solute carrier family 25 phosphate transporter 3